MISINLLKRTTVGKKPKAAVPRWLFRFAVILVVGAGIVVAGVEIMRWWITEPALRLSLVSEQKKEIGKTIAPETTVLKHPAAPLMAAAPETTRTAIRAPAESLKTTPVAAPAVEIAKKSAADTATGHAKPAPAMSKEDSIRCQIAFANRVLAAFSYDLPPDVEFADIAVDSFRNVTADGVISTCEGAEKFFAGLQEKKFNLYPPPHTYIRPNGSKGFRFRIESSVAFISQPDSTFAAGSAGDFRSAVTGFSDLFTRNGLSLRNPLKATVACSGKKCRGYVLTGSGAYSDFVAFVRDVYLRHIPCAFRSVRLEAAENGKIEINAEVDFFTDK